MLCQQNMARNLGSVLRTKNEDESQQAGAEGQPHTAHVHLQSILRPGLHEYDVNSTV